jgi:acyl-CoA reductase-like NAD-dependent aldehyde dehydrogenase
VGKKVAQNCAARLAKVQLEMGGKNPQVVLDDADLDVAVSSRSRARSSPPASAARLRAG